MHNVVTAHHFIAPYPNRSKQVKSTVESQGRESYIFQMSCPLSLVSYGFSENLRLHLRIRYSKYLRKKCQSQCSSEREWKAQGAQPEKSAKKSQSTTGTMAVGSADWSLSVVLWRLFQLNTLVNAFIGERTTGKYSSVAKLRSIGEAGVEFSTLLLWSRFPQQSNSTSHWIFDFITFVCTNRRPVSALIVRETYSWDRSATFF